MPVSTKVNVKHPWHKWIQVDLNEKTSPNERRDNSSNCLYIQSFSQASLLLGNGERLSPDVLLNINFILVFKHQFIQ